MYCYESRGTDVDHFEPIKVAPLRTFDWSNHLLACGYCNQQSKREHYPLGAGGMPLLLNPFGDDPADHMTMGPSGSFIELSPEGAATIALLRLNERKELVRARAVSWSSVVRVFMLAAAEGRSLGEDDLEILQMLPVVDAFHHFAHDMSAGRLATKAVPPAAIAAAEAEVSRVRHVFPRCAI